MSTNADYSLGSSDAEHQRLMLQARVLRQWTDRFLQTGGSVIYFEADLTSRASTACPRRPLRWPGCAGAVAW